MKKIKKKKKNLKNQTEITIPVVIHIVHRAVHSNIGSGKQIYQMNKLKINYES